MKHLTGLFWSSLQHQCSMTGKNKRRQKLRAFQKELLWGKNLLMTRGKKKKRRKDRVHANKYTGQGTLFCPMRKGKVNEEDDSSEFSLTLPPSVWWMAKGLGINCLVSRLVLPLSYEYILKLLGMLKTTSHTKPCLFSGSSYTYDSLIYKFGTVRN